MPKVLLIDNGSSYIQNLQYLLGGFGLDTTIADYRNLHEVHTQGMDLVVLSGGHKFAVADHMSYYSRELALIRNLDKPILGICLGFELMAVAFGAHLELLLEKDKGLREIQVSVSDPIFNRSSFTVYESHQFAVQSVSSPLVALATSVYGVEVITHESKPIYGFQFHPEVMEEKQFGDELCARVINKLLHWSNG